MVFVRTEVYAVVQTFRKLDYMLACENQVSIFTDHRTLPLEFHPTVMESSLGPHMFLKVIRVELPGRCV